MHNLWIYKMLIPLDKVFMSFFKVEYINKEYIPKSGGVILAGNHTSKLDPLLLMSSSTRTIHFLAKIELFKGYKKYFFRALGAIPVDRSRRNPEVIDLSSNYLRKGMVIGIFPEGTINKSDKKILPFKYGAVKMAIDTNSKIVPFAIVGKYKFLRRSVKIIFGLPYNVSNDISKELKILENKVIKLKEAV